MTNLFGSVTDVTQAILKQISDTPKGSTIIAAKLNERFAIGIVPPCPTKVRSLQSRRTTAWKLTPRN